MFLQGCALFAFRVAQICAVAMYKPEGSAVPSAAASSIASDKGVLIAARKSSVAPSVKEQIICGALVMDSDIPKVLILHVTESRSYLAFGSKVVARKEIEHVVRAFALWKSKRAWDVSER